MKNYKTIEQRRYFLERYRKYKQEAISLLGGKCVVCGSIDSLQFDHINPKTKNFNISKIVSKDKFLEELKKCQLLCINCHREKNKIDNGEAIHGSLSMYRHHGCRCKFCVFAYKKYMQHFKNTHKRITVNGKRRWIKLGDFV